jgi:hypothetical protein
MATKILKTLPKQSFDYHSRKCVICRHPDRAAIESASRLSKKIAALDYRLR